MMMQNSTLSVMLLNPGITDLPQRSTARTSGKSDDTFMQMLNERINASKTTGLKDRPLTKAELPLKANNTQIDKKKTEFKPSGTAIDGAKKSGTEEVSNPKSNEALKSDEAEEETKKTLTNLETLLALLEQLMARLDAKNITAAEALTDESAIQDFFAVNPENQDPMALLKAFLEGDADKLKSLMDQINASQLPGELQDILGNIRELLKALGADVNSDTAAFELKAKINGAAGEEIINRLKAQVSDTITRLEEQVSALKAQIGEIPEQEGQLSVEAIKNDETSAHDGTDDDAKADEKASGTSGLQMAQTDVNTQAVQAEDFDAQPVGATVVPVQTGMTGTAARVEKTPLPLTQKPLEQNVTNQVMMKVKLMAGENKQEMEMHLKPESLGKLSLKIIHERGEILAKITAENEQVKGILESNMQLLKDALEKSGLSVQSLSVSVGNKEEKNPSEQAMNEQMRSGSRNSVNSVKAATSADVGVDRARIRDYYQPTSQIDLTA